MKNFFDRIFAVLPHVNIALAVVVITCFVIDRFNRMMEFMNSDVTKILVLIFAILSLVQAILYIIFRRTK